MKYKLGMRCRLWVRGSPALALQPFCSKQKRIKKRIRFILREKSLINCLDELGLNLSHPVQLAKGRKFYLAVDIFCFLFIAVLWPSCTSKSPFVKRLMWRDGSIKRTKNYACDPRVAHAQYGLSTIQFILVERGHEQIAQLLRNKLDFHLQKKKE